MPNAALQARAHNRDDCVHGVMMRHAWASEQLGAWARRLQARVRRRPGSANPNWGCTCYSGAAGAVLGVLARRHLMTQPISAPSAIQFAHARKKRTASSRPSDAPCPSKPATARLNGRPRNSHDPPAASYPSGHKCAASPRAIAISGTDSARKKQEQTTPPTTGSFDCARRPRTLEIVTLGEDMKASLSASTIAATQIRQRELHFRSPNAAVQARAHNRNGSWHGTMMRHVAPSEQPWSRARRLQALVRRQRCQDDLP